MNYEKRMKLYDKAFQVYGETQQKLVAIEEMSELTKEIVKDLRGNRNQCPLIDEIADVEIMLEQLKLLYNIDPTMLETRKQYKLDRLKERLSLIGEVLPF